MPEIPFKLMTASELASYLRYLAVTLKDSKTSENKSEWERIDDDVFNLITEADYLDEIIE